MYFNRTESLEFHERTISTKTGGTEFARRIHILGLMQQIRPPWDLGDVLEKYPLSEDILSTILYREVLEYNNLIKLIKSDLAAISRVAKGYY